MRKNCKKSWIICINSIRPLVIIIVQPFNCASIAAGLAEVQSGKGFSPASGTFSTQGLNMEWTTSIQEITEDRNRQTDNLLNSGTIEEGAIDGRFSSESEEKGFDGKN